MMIGYDIYDCFTTEHFRLRQRMTLTTKIYCSRLYVSTFKGGINRYPKIPYTNTFEIRFFVSVDMMNDDIRCGSVVFKRSNIANILPLKNKCQINCDSFQIVFKMSFTADECCNMYYLALGAAENNAAFS
jgi:hypothetical protein